MEIASFHETGRRITQQDALLIRPDKGVFVVCDGVGGAAQGDVASRTTVNCINEQIDAAPANPTSAATLVGWLTAVQQQLNAYTAAHPDAKGMATTLAMVGLNGSQAICAHIGDSRIYHFSGRLKKCLWHSRDHSLVQELYEQGLLKTPEEMAAHPLRNRITRALKAAEPQGSRRANHHAPNPDLCTRALDSGDILLLCSDGVLEPFSNRELETILCGDAETLTAKIDKIKTRCLTESNDNCTCIAVQIYF